MDWGDTQPPQRRRRFSLKKYCKTKSILGHFRPSGRVRFFVLQYFSESPMGRRLPNTTSRVCVGVLCAFAALR